MDLTSGYPFWLVNDGLPHAYPKLDGDADCQVAILGGGITGALVAHHLIGAGIDAIVIDRRDVGTGSTAGSTALLQYEIDTPLADLIDRRGEDHATRAYLACRDAIHKLQVLSSKLSFDTGFAWKKSLYLASRKRDRKALHKEWELRRGIGIDVDFLTEADITARFPFSRPAALLSADAAQVDPYAFAHALLHDACERGLRVFDRTDVAKVETTREGVTLRSASEHVIRAKHVVFASGYETHSFLERQVAKLISTYAIVSEPMTSIDGWNEDRCLIWEHAHPYLYMRTTHDGRIIVGGEDERFRNPVRRDALIPRKTKTLIGRFNELFPDVRFDVAFASAGTFGETDDGLPYIGEHPDWPSAYFALGYGGNGITFSLLAAEIIRDALIGARNDNADLFRFDR